MYNKVKMVTLLTPYLSDSVSGFQSIDYSPSLVRRTEVSGVSFDRVRESIVVNVKMLEDLLFYVLSIFDET